MDCFDVNIGTGTMYMMVRMVLVRRWLRFAEAQPNRIHRARRLGGRGYIDGGPRIPIKSGQA